MEFVKILIIDLAALLILSEILVFTIYYLRIRDGEDKFSLSSMLIIGVFALPITIHILFKFIKKFIWDEE